MGRLAKLGQVILAVAAISVPVAAHASKLSLLGGATVTKDEVSVPRHSAASSYGWGRALGALYEASLPGSVVGLEFGALYMTKLMVTSVDASSTVENRLPYVEIPVLLRLWLGSNVSLVAGGYAARGAGSVRRKVTVGHSESTSVETFDDIQLEIQDFGLVGSVSFFFPIGVVLGFAVDVRYDYSVSDLSKTPTESHRLRTASVLGGLQLRF